MDLSHQKLGVTAGLATLYIDTTGSCKKISPSLNFPPQLLPGKLARPCTTDEQSEKTASFPLSLWKELRHQNLVNSRNSFGH